MLRRLQQLREQGSSTDIPSNQPLGYYDFLNKTLLVGPFQGAAAYRQMVKSGEVDEVLAALEVVGDEGAPALADVLSRFP